MILTDTPTRIVFGHGISGTHHLVPELPLVGWTSFRHARPDHLRPHLHSQAYELHLVVDGEVEWVVGGESHLLTKGDVFVTRPGEPHGGAGGVMHPCTLLWFLLAEGAADLPRLDRLPRRVQATAALALAFQRVFDEHAHPDIQSAASVRATLGLLLIDLDRSRRAQATGGDDPRSAALARATAYLARDLASPASVAGACAAARLSHTTLGRLFVQRFGLSIIGWRNRERLRAAAHRLCETDESLTSIATELGFSSSQHFSTAFRQRRGVSPSSFRAQARAQSDRERTPVEWSPAIERRHWAG